MAGLEWTEDSFDATHLGPFGDEYHGHTWFVRIWWPAEPLVDVRWMQARLATTLNPWDHHALDGLIDPPTNYGVALAISKAMPDVVRVDVWRKGRVPCGARWTA